MRGTPTLLEGPAGSIGGITYSKVAAGFDIAKIKMKPNRRTSTLSVRTKSTLSILVQHWKLELSQSDRDDWVDAAALYQQSKGGVEYDISGYNLFIAFNSLNYLYRDSILNSPTIFVGRINTPTMEFSWNDVTKKVRFDPDPDNGAFNYLITWCTNAVHPGMTYRKIRYRHQQLFNPQISYPQDLDADTRGEDGVIWVRWRQLDRRGGISSEGIATVPYVYS